MQMNKSTTILWPLCRKMGICMNLVSYDSFRYGVISQMTIILILTATITRKGPG